MFASDLIGQQNVSGIYYHLNKKRMALEFRRILILVISVVKTTVKN